MLRRLRQPGRARGAHLLGRVSHASTRTGRWSSRRRSTSRGRARWSSTLDLVRRRRHEMPLVKEARLALIAREVGRLADEEATSNPVASGDFDEALAGRLVARLDERNAAVSGAGEPEELAALLTGDDGELTAGVYGWTWGRRAGSRRCGCARPARARDGLRAPAGRGGRGPAARLPAGGARDAHLPGARVLCPAPATRSWGASTTTRGPRTARHAQAVDVSELAGAPPGGGRADGA